MKAKKRQTQIKRMAEGVKDIKFRISEPKKYRKKRKKAKLYW